MNKQFWYLPLLCLAVCSGANELNLQRSFSDIDRYVPFEEKTRNATVGSPLLEKKPELNRSIASIEAFEKTAVDLNGSVANISAHSNAETESIANTGAEDQVVYISIDKFQEEVLESEVPVLVDFTASWCGPCSILDPVIESLMPELSGRARVYMVDTDKSPEIATQYKVTQLPTIVFFDNGIESHRTSSIYPRDAYIRYLEGFDKDTSIQETTLELLDEDWFRRHFLLTEKVVVIQETMDRYPGLLTKKFANGQTPLSAVLNYPHTRNEREAILKLILAQSTAVSTNDLPGLGRCE